MAGWLDYLNTFVPKSVTPQSYDYFRALYPPAARPMPSTGGLSSPGNAPMPGNPIPPQNYVRPEMDPNRALPAAPDLPAGEMPWLSLARNYMTEGGAAPPMTLRINRPNVNPASDPPPSGTTSAPPMFGVTDTLGAINSVPYANDASPVTKTGPDFGADNPLWGMLTAAGPAMMQPSWYGFSGQLGQGLTAAAEHARKAPMEKLQRRLLEAQVGKTEQEGDVRKQLMALGKSLPADHPARPFALLGLPKEFAEKMSMDPNKLFSVGPDGKPVLNQAYFDAEIALNKAKQPNVNVNTQLKMEGEAAGVDALRQKYRAEAAAAKDPAEKARLTAIADAYERRATIGDKQFPEWYTKAAAELGNATSSASELAKLLMDPKTSRLNFNDRAGIKQQLENLRLAYATLKNRGANFTDTEQAMIEALYGGDPLSLQNMVIRDRADFVKKLETAHGAMIREWNGIDNAFRTGKVNIAPFPKYNTAPNAPPPPSGFYPMR
jgi:hypothetical protein